MPDQYRDVTVLCKGGLFRNEDALSLASTNPGAAIRMLNFEVSQFGGYRRISGFAPYDASNTTVPGLGTVLGVWIHGDTVYAARRNIGDATGTLGSDPITVTNESTTLTIAHTSHGLSVGSFVTFAGAAAVGGLTINGVEMVVVTVTSNSYTVVFTSAGTSSASGGGASVTYSYSYNYFIYKHVAGVGWGSNVGPTGRVALGVKKLRVSNHNFTGSEVTVLVDGINRPARHSGTTFSEIFDKQGTAAADTETQLSNAFDSVNGDATVTVDHVAHTLAVGDVVRYSGVNVNVGGVSINDTNFTVATVASVDLYTFELDSASGVTGQTNVGGTAISFFYTRANTSTVKDIVAAKFTTDFSDHQFFAGMSGTLNHLVFSKPSNDLDYTGATAGVINVGFTITGLAKFRESLYVFGSDKIKRLTGNAATDFALAEVTSNIGCIASDSILEIGGDILFLASDGIRPIQGTARIGDIELETVSKPIQQILQALPSLYDLDNMSSVVIRNKTQFRYFFPSTSIASSEGIIGGLRFADRRAGWEFGELLGIRAYVAASGLIDNQEVVVHGDSDGKVHRQESGDDFNGAEVISVYATPFLYFDSTERRKVFQKLSIFTRPEGVSTVNLGIRYDWDDPNVSNPLTYPIGTADVMLRYATTGGEYDSTFTFGSISPVLETHIQGSARSISLVFTSIGTQSPYSISGFSLTYQDAGYR